MPTYVALDLHRDYVHRCQLEPHPEGAKMKHSRFPNTREGWARFVETETGPQTWVAFEVTGNALEVYDLLSSFAACGPSPGDQGQRGEGEGIGP